MLFTLYKYVAIEYDLLKWKIVSLCIIMSFFSAYSFHIDSNQKILQSLSGIIRVVNITVMHHEMLIVVFDKGFLQRQCLTSGVSM